MTHIVHVTEMSKIFTFFIRPGPLRIFDNKENIDDYAITHPFTSHKELVDLKMLYFKEEKPKFSPKEIHKLFIGKYDNENIPNRVN